MNVTFLKINQDYITMYVRPNFKLWHTGCLPWSIVDFAWPVYYSRDLFLCFQCSALSKFINKAADGGITALHMAALNGYYDCVHLLLDLHANVSVVTFHYGTSMDLIGNSLKMCF